MTKKLLSLISGLLIMLLSISSLYGIEFKQGYYSVSRSEHYTFANLFSKKGQTDYKKALAAVFSETKTNNNKPVLLISAYVSDKVKLKDYALYIGNEKGSSIIQNVGVYTGRTEKNNHYRIELNIQKQDFSKLSNNYIILNINNDYYSFEMNEFLYPLYKYERELEQERRKKEYEEAAYKRSSEYKQKVGKPFIDNLNKNQYEVEKDAFDNRIHITDKQQGSKFTTAQLNILNQNSVYIIPRVEVKTEYYSPTFAATFNIKFRSDGKGIGYIRGVSFSDGDNSVLIRVGNYGIGETGNTFNMAGMTISQVTVRLYNTKDLYKIFTEVGSKPILVRIHEGTGSFDTKISEGEKQAFIKLLKLNNDLENIGG